MCFFFKLYCWKNCFFIVKIPNCIFAKCTQHPILKVLRVYSLRLNRGVLGNISAMAEMHRQVKTGSIIFAAKQQWRRCMWKLAKHHVTLQCKIRTRKEKTDNIIDERYYKGIATKDQVPKTSLAKSSSKWGCWPVDLPNSMIKTAVVRQISDYVIFCVDFDRRLSQRGSVPEKWKASQGCLDISCLYAVTHRKRDLDV